MEDGWRQREKVEHRWLVGVERSIDGGWDIREIIMMKVGRCELWMGMERGRGRKRFPENPSDMWPNWLQPCRASWKFSSCSFSFWDLKTHTQKQTQTHTETHSGMRPTTTHSPFINPKTNGRRRFSLLLLWSLGTAGSQNQSLMVITHMEASLHSLNFEDKFEEGRTV